LKTITELKGGPDMNEAIKTILTRRSIRSYEARMVEAEKIDIILECAKFAPSARNLQPWHFTVITNRRMLDCISAENQKIMLGSPLEMVRKMAQDPNFDSFRGAPVAIIVSGRKDADFAPGDCANAVENMALAACSLGLGSCYLASFKHAIEAPDGSALKKELQIPEGYTALYALSIGYGNETLGERMPRLDNTVTWLR
jgi:nitroreductase